MYDEEEVLRLSAYTGMGDSDDDSDDGSVKGAEGKVAMDGSQVPESISAFGKKTKATYKKRKRDHDVGDESGT